MKFVCRHIFRISALILLVSSMAGCLQTGGDSPDNTRTSSHPALDSLSNKLSSYSYAGKHDSVIYTARPALIAAQRAHDTLTMVYAGLNMAQSFLFLGNMDSVQRYIDLMEPLKDYPIPANLHIMRSNVLGSYSLRSSLDYSNALNCYMEGLAWADRRQHANSRIALLSNIVNIFYVLNSDKGLEYARDAYDLAMTQPEINTYSKCAACLVMAQMYYVTEQYDTATRFLKEADTYAGEGHTLSQISFIQAMSAWICQHKNDVARAYEFYDRALAFIKYTDPGTASQVYLTYGEFLSEQGKRAEAASMYEKGLQISDASGNIEYRKSLLGHIADLACDRDDLAAAVKYARMYSTYSETISNRREAEFRELIEQREESEHQKMMLAKELEQRKIEQRNLLLLSISIGVSGFSFLLGLLYNRKRKMYRKLVKQHQEYLSQLDLKTNYENDEHNDSDRQLFSRIEHLMRHEKIYRMKNLTLELLAEMTDSNRTYCSRAINTFAGMSFNRYLDTFRIAEATRIIASDCDHILFKQLADDIGYNSVTVFSKAFQRETGCSPSIYKKEIKGYNSNK